jgi:hypothetical protein
MRRVVIKEEKGIITMSSLDNPRTNMEATLQHCNELKFRYVVCVIWLMMDLRNEPGFLRRELAGSELLLGMHGSPGLRGGQSQKNHHGRPSPWPATCRVRKPSGSTTRLHPAAGYVSRAKCQ